jgi:hypothetical protein
MAKAPHGPTDDALSGLHEAITRPDRISQVKARLIHVFPSISNISHRQFLQDKLHEIEQARNSASELASIQAEIDRWNEREFPVKRGFR